MPLLSSTPRRNSFAQTCALILITILLGGAAAHSAGAAARVEARGTTVLVHGRLALRLRAANGSKSAAERADLAASRLLDYLQKGGSLGAIQAKHAGSRWRVSAGEDLVLYATRADARASGGSSAGLAYGWAASLRHLLSMPAVTLSLRSLRIPVGETRTIRIGGYADDLSASAAAGGEAVGTTIHGRQLSVRAERPGNAHIAVTGDGKTAYCTVLVRMYAGRLAMPVDAEVTGSPAPSSLSSAAAALAVRRWLPREPGASVTILSSPRVRGAIRPGGSAIAVSEVRVAGPDLIPLTGRVRVTVRNRDLPAQPVARLLYSNSPERITRAGVLFVGRMEGAATTRLFYHHINADGGPMALSVTLVNPCDRPITLRIVPGFAPADPDAVRAGCLAGQTFFPRYLRGAGEIYTLPAGSSVPLAVHRLAPNNTASGMAEVRLLSDPGTRCLVRVSAEPWGERAWRVTSACTDAWRRVMPRPATQTELAETPVSPDVFPTPVKTVQAEYTIGQPWTWIPLGKEPITDADGSRRLDGNYGVLYRIQVTVHNPTDAAQKIEVAFEPGAGPAGGVFTIAGRYVEVASAYPREERSLAHFDVAPNGTRTIAIETVPLGGSAYPAALIVR